MFAHPGSLHRPWGTDTEREQAELCRAAAEQRGAPGLGHVLPMVVRDEVDDVVSEKPGVGLQEGAQLGDVRADGGEGRRQQDRRHHVVTTGG